MKILSLFILLSLSYTVGAQTTQQDSAHRAYHMMRKKDPKQNNPYAFADSSKAKKTAEKLKKKTK